MSPPGKLLKVITQDEWLNRLLSKARNAGEAGLPPGKLGRPKAEAQARVFDAALAEAIHSGLLLKVTKGAKQKFYSPEFSPPSPEQQFRNGVMEKVTPGVAWLAEALTGKGKDAVNKGEWLEQMAREGKLARIHVVTSGKTKKPAFITGVADSALPDWPRIEQAAHAVAATRVDRTVGFEELAKRLGVTPLVVKTAVTQRMDLRGGLQLVRGEPREVDDPTTAGLQSGGDVYYRFHFLD